MVVAAASLCYLSPSHGLDQGKDCAAKEVHNCQACEMQFVAARWNFIFPPPRQGAWDSKGNFIFSKNHFLQPYEGFLKGKLTWRIVWDRSFGLAVFLDYAVTQMRIQSINDSNNGICVNAMHQANVASTARK